MKKIIVIATLCFALLSLGIVPAQAAEASTGSKVFTANCAACHAGGNNLVISTKNLRKETLKKYDMFSSEAIQTQVVNGKNAMPAFGGRLSPEQIEAVADYVLEQAEKGWT